jgi:hypothetical protein
MDQPWAAPGRHASARIKVRIDFVRVDEHLYWRSQGREWPAKQAANACEQHLTSRGFTRSRHDYDSDGKLVPQQPSTNYSGPYGPGAATWVYSESMTIVCVDPLIAIICDDPVTVPAFTRSKGVMDHDGEWFVSRIEHSLGDATFYGTKGPCTSNLRWLSPDLNRGPELIEFDQSGVARIETPWGAIEVRSDGQQWTTTAEKRPKPKQPMPRLPAQSD